MQDRPLLFFSPQHFPGRFLPPIPTPQGGYHTKVTISEKCPPLPPKCPQRGRMFTNSHYFFLVNIFQEDTFLLSPLFRRVSIQIQPILRNITQNHPHHPQSARRGVECMTDINYFFNLNISFEHTYSLFSTLEGAVIQNQPNSRKFTLQPPLRPSKCPDGVIRMSHSQYFFHLNIFHEHTQPLSLLSRAATI